MKIQDIIIGLLAIIGIGGLLYGFWYIKRTVNYTFQYESMVQEQIDISLAKYKCDCNCSKGVK